MITSSVCFFNCFSLLLLMVQKYTKKVVEGVAMDENKAIYISINTLCTRENSSFATTPRQFEFVSILSIFGKIPIRNVGCTMTSCEKSWLAMIVFSLVIVSRYDYIAIQKIQILHQGKQTLISDLAIRRPLDSSHTFS